VTGEQKALQADFSGSAAAARPLHPTTRASSGNDSVPTPNIPFAISFAQ
jgi:hypothetical protein